jgi:hypothetical protein
MNMPKTIKNGLLLAVSFSRAVYPVTAQLAPPGTPMDQIAAATPEKPPVITYQPGIEGEFVTVSEFGVFPSAIKRKTGKFYLLMANRSRSAPIALVLDSPTVSAVQVASLAETMNLPQLGKLRSLIALIDVPAGVYQFKAQKTGKVLSTLTIE